VENKPTNQQKISLAKKTATKKPQTKGLEKEDKGQGGKGMSFW